jgi:signal transduction histidine kinase
LRSGRDYGSVPLDVLAGAVDASSAPIFGIFDGEFGRGIVGGRIVDIGRHGEETGRLIARIVDGEPAGSIPPVYVANNPAAIDWRALERWGIDPGRLPDDAVVSFRVPTVWDEYGPYIAGVGAVLLLQSLLIVGLVVQRSRRLQTQRSLAERLRFERLYADLSTRFVDLPSEEIGAALAGSLEEIRVMLDADRVSIVLFDDSPALVSIMYSAMGDGIEPLAKSVDVEDIRELVEHVRRGESLQYSHPDEIPPEFAAARAAAVQRSIPSGIVVPLHAAGENFGWVSIAAVREPRRWPEDAAREMRTLADIFANALLRQRTMAELERSEEMSSAVLKSINAQLCVLDRDGRILTMNDAWRLDAGETNGSCSCRLVEVKCPMKAGERVRCAAVEAGPFRDRIRSALDGPVETFAAEYHTAMPNVEAWYLLSVEQFRALEGGVVLSHQNVTARKRAEFDAEQRRQELAHVSRVSTMGELAASIAHELNQPLTGVLANAQAALRFLDTVPPDLGEVRDILTDIVEDDRRAGEVIRRLRAMLSQSAIEPADVDVNEVVVDVVKLLANNATLRHVTLETSLSDGLPSIRADKIQLEQVILNLVVNAMDAMKETPVEERRVTIRTAASDASTVLISVTDRGPGIDLDKLGRIFQPFFTTKLEGMGMGLSIARTIVEAHGGLLWAANNPDRGASFQCRIPVAHDSE